MCSERWARPLWDPSQAVPARRPANYLLRRFRVNAIYGRISRTSESSERAPKTGVSEKLKLPSDPPRRPEEELNFDWRR